MRNGQVRLTAFAKATAVKKPDPTYETFAKVRLKPDTTYDTNVRG